MAGPTRSPPSSPSWPRTKAGLSAVRSSAWTAAPSVGRRNHRFSVFGFQFSVKPKTENRKPKTEMNEPLVYLNGQLIPASQAHIAIYDAGIVLGATVTEQSRTFHKHLWRLDEHLDRLFRSLRYTRMDIGLSKEQLAGISQELIEHNARLLDDAGELGIIHFVTAGEHPTYAGMSGRPARTTPTVCAHTYPLPFELWNTKMVARVHEVTPPIRQVPAQYYDK